MAEQSDPFLTHWDGSDDGGGGLDIANLSHTTSENRPTAPGKWPDMLQIVAMKFLLAVCL